MRAGDYLAFAWRGVARQPVRTLLTVLSLAISATIVISLVAITLGAQRTITTERGLTQGLETMVVTPNAVVTTGLMGGAVQVANADAEKMTEATVTRLGNVPGVAQAVPLAGVPELRQFRVAGSSTPFVASAVTVGATGYRLPLAAGAPAGKAGQVVLGASFVDAVGLPSPASIVGRTVTLTTVAGYRGAGAKVPGPQSTQQDLEAFSKRPTTLRARVVGVTDDPRFRQQLVLPLAWARQIRTPKVVENGRLTPGPDQLAESGYSSVVVEAVDHTAVGPVASAIRRLGYGVASTQEQIDRINRYVLIMWLVLGAVALVSLLTAGLGIANTMLMTIAEERYAINVWRVCGARRRVIRNLYVVQAFLLGLAGGAVGMLLGYGLTWSLARQIRRVLADQGMATLTVATATPKILLAGLMATVVVGVLAAIYPSGRAARLDPGAFLSAQ